MTDYIPQRHSNDCCIAATAMALALPYELVEKLCIDAGFYKPGGKGISFFDMLDAIQDYGIQGVTVSKGVPKGNANVKHLPFALSPEFFTSTLWGRPCLLSVPSLNYAGKRHAIFYDGIAVYDPSPKVKYAVFGTEMRVTEALVFQPKYREVVKASLDK